MVEYRKPTGWVTSSPMLALQWPLRATGRQGFRWETTGYRNWELPPSIFSTWLRPRRMRMKKEMAHQIKDQRQRPCNGLLARQRVADPGDHTVPLTFFNRREVNQHAVHKMASKVATVVPNFVFPKAGHHKKSRCHPPVHNIWGWILLR